MKEILGKAKTVRELLGGAKYSIDYYQREYRWQRKQVKELVAGGVAVLGVDHHVHSAFKSGSH